jgi:gamma-glutamyltranspeptidase/glutathione hydrolase
MSGVVVAPQPEAAEAGAEILKAGGNAVDAAIACALVQTAVDPFMCGIAGFGSCQIYALGGAHEVIDFHGRAPLKATPDMWEDLIEGESEDGFGFLLKGQVNQIGYLSVTAPMTLAAFDHALRAHGTMPLAALLEPAIAWAEDGFLVRPAVHGYWTDPPAPGRVAHPEYVLRHPGTRAIYAGEDGGLRPVGARIRNPDMARTYRRIAEHGARDFYEGAIAREIAADFAANRGLLDLEDLAAVRPVVGPPLEGSYRGLRVTTNRPPGGGVQVLEMLNILEAFDVGAMGHGSADHIALLAEAMKIATIDKDAKVGDPAFVDVPLEELTSKDYAAGHAEAIRAGRKAHVKRLNPGGEESPDTTHVVVVDGAGMAVTMTHSIGMPSGVVTPGLGFMYNGCMGAFDPRPGRAGSLAPGKARFTAMAPTLLFDDDGPMFAVGAPGGTKISMAVMQAIVNAIDFGMSALEAVAAPRVLALSDTLDLSNRALHSVERELRARGYRTRRSPRSHDFASPHAARRRADGSWEGGADPGRDGMAVEV